LVLSLPAVNRIPVESAVLDNYGALLMLFPPAWFLGMEHTLLGTSDALLLRLAQIAGLASTIVLITVAVSYARLYRRFEQLTMPLTGDRRGPLLLRLPGLRRSRSEHPARQAIVEFAAATL